MICINNNNLTKYTSLLFSACREQSQISLVTYTTIFLCRLKFLLRYAIGWPNCMRVPLPALEVSMYRSKGLQNSVGAKTRAEHNNYFSFSKASYCSTSQIHSCYYCSNQEIGSNIQAKDLTNLLQQLAKPRNWCSSLIYVEADQSFTDDTLLLIKLEFARTYYISKVFYLRLAKCMFSF